MQNPHRLNFFTFVNELANAKKARFTEKACRVEVFPREEKLILETYRKLDLTFAIQSAVGTGHLTEIIIVVQSRPASRVKRAVNAENVGAVKDVKAFGK